MPTWNVSMIATVTGWSFVSYPQTSHPSGYSSSSVTSMRISTSLMTCSLSWMRSVWKRLKMLSGRKWQGKSCLPAAMANACAGSTPGALLSALWNTFCNCRCERPSPLATPELLLRSLRSGAEEEMKDSIKCRIKPYAANSVLAQHPSWGAAPPMKQCCRTIVPIASKILKVMQEPHASGSAQARFVTQPFTPKWTLLQWHILFQKFCSTFKFCSHPSNIARLAH